MNASFTCANCQTSVRVDVCPGDKSMDCPQCGRRWSIAAEAFGASGSERGKLQQCLACPCVDLFVRKDFPQRLGVLIVVVGLASSCVFYSFHWLIWTFGALFATALVDLVLYSIVGNVLECYRCHAQYRDVEGLESFAPFELETFERHRQMTARTSATDNIPQSPAGEQDRAAGEQNRAARTVSNTGKAP